MLPRWEPPEEVPFAVHMENFYPKKIRRVEWGWDGEGSGRQELAQQSSNPDGTFTATSIWRVPSRSLIRPELRVRVSVQQSPAEIPVWRELSLRDAGEEGDPTGEEPGLLPPTPGLWRELGAGWEPMPLTPFAFQQCPR